MSADGGAVAAVLRSLGCCVAEAANGELVVGARDPDWLHDALDCLGHVVWRDGDHVHLAAPEVPVRLAHAVQAALAPQALLLDLDGVLADIEARKPLTTAAVVQQLAERWPLGVVTSCPRRLAESVLTRHGFAPFVRTLVGDEDGPGKPDPFPVRLALQRLGVAAAWMVGDNPGDVTAARAAGVVPLAIAPHGIGAESHAERLRAAGAVRLLALRDVLALGR